MQSFSALKSIEQFIHNIIRDDIELTLTPSALIKRLSFLQYKKFTIAILDDTLHFSL